MSSVKILHPEAEAALKPPRRRAACSEAEILHQPD